MRKNNSSFFKYLFLIAIIGILFCYYKYNNYLETPVDENDTKEYSFQIKKGSTIKEIANNLEEKNIISSEYTFYLYAKYNKLDKEVLAGRFLLKKNQTIPEILNTISDPKNAQNIFLIQEGLKITEIDKKLTEENLINSGDFISAVKNFDGYDYYKFLDQNQQKLLPYPLEGYIFPDTYFIDPANFKPEKLIYLSLDNFEKKYEGFKDKLGDKKLQDIIIMASMIEKEVKLKTDKEIVSGILWKRFANNWMLGVDATLLYLKNDNKITETDLTKDSPYNTRTKQGLPLSPICNPGIESILAGISPAESEYWFYLTDLSTGKTIYAKTNDEHNLNKSKYIK